MATKNQIANNLWITGIIEIMRVKSSKQNCLERARKERFLFWGWARFGYKKLIYVNYQ